MSSTPKKTTNKKDSGPVTIHKVPKDLRIRFKIACLHNGTTMRRVMLNLIKEYLEKEGKHPTL